MKKMIATLMVGLAACSVSVAEPSTTTEVVETTTTEAPTTTVAPTTTTTEAPTTTTVYELTRGEKEMVFLSVIRSMSADYPYNFTDAATDADLIELAEIGCDLFRAGLTWDEIVEEGARTLIDVGLTEDADFAMMGAVLGAGTQTFCPEFAQEIQ